MEKSIEFGFEHYIHMIPGVREIDAKNCSPLGKYSASVFW